MDIKKIVRETILENLSNDSEVDTEKIISEVESILNRTLPKKAWRLVDDYKNHLGDGYSVRIMFAASEGQKPQAVSLRLDLDDMELGVQIYGGMGGRDIYRIPNKDNPKERILAMARVRIPFRKPKPELRFIYGAIEKFALNWVRLLKENRDVLMYQNYVDYDELLSS